MTTSLLYSHPLIYEGLMLALYGRHYFDRYKALASRVPAGCEVLDICCGPAVLYHRYLEQQGVSYTGVDVNPRFVERLTRSGASGHVMDLREDQPLPAAEIVIMQASLYHFLPDVRPILERMLAAARQSVMIAEPVRNLSDSRNGLIRALARRSANPGTGDQQHRFNEATLAEVMRPYQECGRVRECSPIANGREQLYVLDATV